MLRIKVGMGLRLKSLDWYNENKDKDGDVCFDKIGSSFDGSLSKYCGQIIKVTRTTDGIYTTCICSDNQKINVPYWAFHNYQVIELDCNEVINIASHICCYDIHPTVAVDKAAQLITLAKLKFE